MHAVKFDFYMLWMRAKDEEGATAPSKKRTTVMTNSPAVATLLRDAQCWSEQRHTPSLDRRAWPWQQYPDPLCELICERVKREKDTLRWRSEVGPMPDAAKPGHQLLAVSHQRRGEAAPAFDVSKTFAQLLSV